MEQLRTVLPPEEIKREPDVASIEIEMQSFLRKLSNDEEKLLDAINTIREELRLLYETRLRIVCALAGLGVKNGL